MSRENCGSINLKWVHFDHKMPSRGQRRQSDLKSDEKIFENLLELVFYCDWERSFKDRLHTQGLHIRMTTKYVYSLTSVLMKDAFEATRKSRHQDLSHNKKPVVFTAFEKMKSFSSLKQTLKTLCFIFVMWLYPLPVFNTRYLGQ